MTFDLPIRLESTANLREHWRVRAKRARQHRAAAIVVPRYRIRLPAVVTITRIAPRKLDTDNLAISAKSLRDGIADRLGIDDGSNLVRWEYRQERGKPREYSVRLQIESVQ